MEKLKEKMELQFKLKTHMSKITRNRDLTRNPQLHSAVKKGVIVPAT